MKRVISGIFVSSLMLLVSPQARAADCDFDKPTGTCQASIEVLSAGGKKPSYYAEIMVRSSAPTCSKVDYFIESTPQRAILRGSNELPESLSGTSPISKKTLKVSKCTAYADRELSKVQAYDAKYGYCASDNDFVARFNEYADPSDTLATLLDFLPKAINVNKQYGKHAHAEYLARLLEEIRRCNKPQ